MSKFKGVCIPLIEESDEREMLRDSVNFKSSAPSLAISFAVVPEGNE